MKRVVTVLMILMLLVPAFATSKPSVDGRAVVADEGVLPRGLFAKTVGYLPGDSVSVTNPSTGVTISVLVLGSVDPSTGIAILLSPEAADKLFITKNTNVQVKITKRTGLLDESATGNAILNADPDKDSDAAIPEQIKNTLDAAQAEAAEVAPVADAAPADEAVETADVEPTPAAAIAATEAPAEIATAPEAAEVAPVADAAPADEAVETALGTDAAPADEAVETADVEPTPASAIAATESPAEIATAPEAAEAAPVTDAAPADEAVETALGTDAAPADEAVETADVEPTPASAIAATEAPAEIAPAPVAAEVAPGTDAAPADEAVETADVEPTPAAAIAATEAPAEIATAPEAAEIAPGTDAAPADEAVETADVEPTPAAAIAATEATDDMAVDSDLFDPFAPIILVPADENPPEHPEVPTAGDRAIVICPEPIEATEASLIEPGEKLPPTAEVPSASTKPEKVKITAGGTVIPSLKELTSGSYYIQIATLAQADNINTIITTYGVTYPIVLVPLKSGSAYQIMVGPLSVDEYGTVLARFKSYGYKDAFLRKIK